MLTKTHQKNKSSESTDPDIVTMNYFTFSKETLSNPQSSGKTFHFGPSGGYIYSSSKNKIKNNTIRSIGADSTLSAVSIFNSIGIPSRNNKTLNCGSEQEELVRILIKYHKYPQSNSRRVRRRLSDEFDNVGIDLMESKNNCPIKSPIMKSKLEETAVVLKTLDSDSNLPQRTTSRVMEQYKIKMCKYYPVQVNEQKLHKSKVSPVFNNAKIVKKDVEMRNTTMSMKDKAIRDMSATISQFIGKGFRRNNNLPVLKLDKICNFNDIYLLMMNDNIKTVNLPEEVYDRLKKPGSVTIPISSLKINSFKSKVNINIKEKKLSAGKKQNIKS